MPAAQKTDIAGIDCMLYLVKDMPRALKFWTETMGLKPTLTYPRGSGHEFTLADGTTFGLFQMPDGTWHRGNGVMFSVGDINAAVEDYKRRGVKFARDGAVMESPLCWLAFAEDSEGNYFALHQRKE
jgi:predicted enzyme related to lactoylglutathione lyase